MQEAELTLDAVLLRTRRSLYEVERLQPGDLIHFGPSELASVRLETPAGRHVATGRLGQIGGMRALRLSAPVGTSPVHPAGLGGPAEGRGRDGRLGQRAAGRALRSACGRAGPGWCRSAGRGGGTARRCAGRQFRRWWPDAGSGPAPGSARAGPAGPRRPAGSRTARSRSSGPGWRYGRPHARPARPARTGVVRPRADACALRRSISRRKPRPSTSTTCRSDPQHRSGRTARAIAFAVRGRQARSDAAKA
jgi:hypothetical protein